MEHVVVGNIRFIKPVIEKVIDVYYLIEEDGKEVLKHDYFLLTYEEMDKTSEQLIQEKKIREQNPKLMIIDETITVNFGDEEIEKHYDTIIEFDKDWIETKNPDKENFEQWLVEFVDEVVFLEGKK